MALRAWPVAGQARRRFARRPSAEEAGKSLWPDLIWSLDDGKRPLPHPGEPRRPLFASITAIGEDVAQPGEEIADRSQHADRAVAILDVGAVHLGADREPVGVGDDVALAPVDLLASVRTRAARRSRSF